MRGGVGWGGGGGGDDGGVPITSSRIKRFYGSSRRMVTARPTVRPIVIKLSFWHLPLQ